jgi:hypothetical protein
MLNWNFMHLKKISPHQQLPFFLDCGESRVTVDSSFPHNYDSTRLLSLFEAPSLCATFSVKLPFGS